MNFPKQVKTRSVVILLSCLLVLSSVSMYYAFSASTPTSGLTDIYIEPPLMESSYVIGIYTAPSTCYLKNGTTGQITTTGTFAVVLSAALTAMTTGGKIFIRAGRYNLTAGISIIYSGTYIEGEGLGGVGEPAVQIDAGITGVTNQLITYTSVPTYSNAFLGGIKNIMFRGQSTANSIAVTVEGFWSDLLFESCGFMYFDHGVKLNPMLTGADKIWNIWFDDCLFEDNIRYGLYLTGTSSVTDMIDRVRVTNSHFYDNLNSVYCDTDYVFHVTFTDNTVQAERGECIKTVSGGRQWIITDNHIFDCGIGANGTYAAILANGTGTIYPDSWLIENNIIANHFTSAPVAMNNSIWLTGTVTNFVIQGNFFFQASEPIRIDGLTSYSSIMVNGNDDYAKNLVFPTENRPYSYLIGAFKSSYYMLNCSTGNVDYQSTNATLVIQFSINNASVNGGVVYVKEGNYLVSGTVTSGSRSYALTPKSNVYLQLSPFARIYQTTPSSLGDSVSLMWFDDSMGTLENFTIDGGIWDGNKGSLRDHRGTSTWTSNFSHYEGIAFYYGTQTRNIVVKNALVENVIGQGIVMGKVNCSLIDHCRVFGCGDNPITVESLNDYTWNHTATISDCYVYGGQDCGINIFWGCGANIIGCTVTNISVYGGSASHFGIILENCHDCIARDCNVYMTSGMGTGLAVLDNPPDFVNNFGANIFSGCHVYGYTGVQSFQTKNAWSIFDGCTFIGGVENYVYGGIIQNCIFTNSSLKLDTWGGGTNYTTIRNNLFINSYIKIQETTGYAYITGNKFQYGSYIRGPNGGITISYVIIESNDFTDSSSPIQMSGGDVLNGTVRWNLGYRTEGSASSNNATTTTWTFTMGNASTVLRAYISFNSTIADPYWSATGNTLTVTTGTIIAANNTACYVEWYCWNYP